VRTAGALFLAFVLLGAAARADDPAVYRSTLLGISATAVTLEGGATLRRAPEFQAPRDGRAFGRTVYLRLDESGAVTPIFRRRRSRSPRGLPHSRRPIA